MMFFVSVNYISLHYKLVQTSVHIKYINLNQQCFLYFRQNLWVFVYMIENFFGVPFSAWLALMFYVEA